MLATNFLLSSTSMSMLLLTRNEEYDMDWSQLIIEGFKQSTTFFASLTKYYVRTGDRVVICTCDDRLVMAHIESEANVEAHSTKVGTWEHFQIVDPLRRHSPERKTVSYGDTIGLRALINGQYASARLDLPNSPLMANIPHVKAWEEFKLCRVPNLSDSRLKYGIPFALQASNKKYVTYNKDGDKKLSATAKAIGDWEVFVFVPLEEPK